MQNYLVILLLAALNGKVIFSYDQTDANNYLKLSLSSLKLRGLNFVYKNYQIANFTSNATTINLDATLTDTVFILDTVADNSTNVVFGGLYASKFLIGATFDVPQDIIFQYYGNMNSLPLSTGNFSELPSLGSVKNVDLSKFKYTSYNGSITVDQFKFYLAKIKNPIVSPFDAVLRSNTETNSTCLVGVNFAPIP